MPLIRCFLILSVLSSCNHTKESPQEKFIQYLNNCQVDSMNHILSDRFSLTITYQHRGYNRKDFLNLYFHDFCKLGTRFSVDEKFVTGDIEDFLIKEENNYLRYFGIREPRWKVSIAKTGDQISRAYIDSTEEYHKYISSWRLQRSKFKEWLKDKYPESDAELLFKDTTGRLLKLADEFSKH